MIMAASLLIAASPVLHFNVSFGQSSDELENRHSITASSNDGIVVTAKRLPGSVETDEQPLETLNTADIAAYGASSLADLLDQISSKTIIGGRRLAPVLLVNGKRVSSPADLAALPPDAILRLEIYPEKVARADTFGHFGNG